MKYLHSTTKHPTNTPPGVGDRFIVPVSLHCQIRIFPLLNTYIHFIANGCPHLKIRIFKSPHTHFCSPFCGCFHICGHDKSAPTAACGLLITLLANWNNVMNILWKIYVRSQNGLRTYSYIVFFLLLYCLFGANMALLCEWLNVYFALFWGSTSLYSTFMWNSGVMLMHCCSKSSSM